MNGCGGEGLRGQAMAVLRANDRGGYTVPSATRQLSQFHWKG